MRSQSIDTPADVERVQLGRFRAMGPRARLESALALNAALDRLAIAGIRARHGVALSPLEERLHLFALRLNREEMRLAFGWDPGDAGG
ncbi:MAG: hypothetical protein ABIU84_00730 [Thermoanaerobaculia bacterium]